MSRSEELRLEITRVFAAIPSVVFANFGDSSELAKWWGPEGFSVGSVVFDPRVGETYRIEMQPPDGEAFFLAGEFRQVDPPAHLAFSFVYENPDPDDLENLVSLSFEDLGESTNVSLTQAPFKTEARRALHHDGWSDSFDRLERLHSR
jgi:uncharacterized protein YndB with AHSA1/START domain